MDNSKLKKLKKLKREYSDEKEGYHYRQYDILGETMAIVVGIRSDEPAVKAFLRLSGKKIPPAKSKKVEDWLTAAVVAYVTAAKSQNAVKLAWKRARVLDHLHDVHGIPPEEIADQIRSRGGIESIAKEAIKENPRRPKAEKRKEKESSAAKKNPFKSANARKESTDDDVDGAEDWDAPGDDADPPGGDDSQIAVRISPALRAKLLAIKPNRRVKMIGVRIDADDWPDVVLEAQDVRRLKD
jgi:hypothetical protein